MIDVARRCLPGVHCPQCNRQLSELDSRLGEPRGGDQQQAERAVREWELTDLGVALRHGRGHHARVAIESLNARFQAAIRRRRHFPDGGSALTVLYIAVRERRPNRANPTGQINGWKSIQNVLSINLRRPKSIQNVLSIYLRRPPQIQLAEPSYPRI